MRKLISLLVLLLVAGSLLAACGSRETVVTPPVDTAATAVAAALTAIPPQPTHTPQPTYTPYPTPNLAGLFCEYEFCIGHPSGFPFFDLEVLNDFTANRSSYQQGILIGFSDSLYIFLSWSQLLGDYDPNVMLTVALQSDLPQDTRLTTDLHGRPVTYTLLQTTPSDLMSYGLVAAWQCGDRQFGWKAYTLQDGQAIDHLRQALSRFACSR
ncbi:MAG: hypothetical protein JXB85_18255 [Anaerolineales bacterium]|nr:hypothetical protein [Anaerolineales bacterium]